MTKLRFAVPIILLVSSSSYAATKTVCGGGTCDYTTISAAVAGVNAGDTLDVKAGNYSEAVTVRKDLTIIGAGSGSSYWSSGGTPLYIDGNHTVSVSGFELHSTGSRALRIADATVTLDDLVMQGMSDATFGLAMSISSGADVTATNLDLNNNDALGQKGGHIYCSQSSLTLSDSTVRQGHSRSSGGAANLYACQASFARVVFEENKSTHTSGMSRLGGAIYAIYSAIDIDNCTFESNEASTSGGAIYANQTEVFIDNVTTFVDNVASSSGGAIYIYKDNLEIQGGSFTTNTVLTSSGSGGAIYSNDGELLLNGVTFGRNSAKYGGAVQGWLSREVDLNNIVAEENTAQSGGAFYFTLTDNLDVANSEFRQNDATGAVGNSSGGALYIARSSGPNIVSISSSTFEENTADTSGGAIFVYDVQQFDIDTSDFDENAAGRSGAIELYSIDSVSATRNLFCANRAQTTLGGAVYNYDSGSTSAEWKNNLFIENTANTAGGAVYDQALYSVTYANNHFLGNDAVIGGAFYAVNTSYDLINNLFAYTAGGNGLDAAYSGTGYTVEYNDFYDNTTSDWSSALSVSSSNNLFVDPKVASYSQDEDCSNDDYMLQYGSPLIDAGDPAILDPDSTRSDIGAFGGDSASSADFADADSDGVVAMWDCDDSAATVYPGATETPYDGIDQDCDGSDLVDVDGDGQAWTGVSGGTDCDDTDDTIYAGATEVYYDGVDQNCDGKSDYDQDEDGEDIDTFASGTDCNDLDPDINSAATEIYYDGVDQNCDGESDYDQDEDGEDIDTFAGGTDCNDLDPDINTAATEIYYDGVDQNCDGLSDYDQDLDGYASAEYAGSDCDDDDIEVYPGAVEIWYDGVDQDCAGDSDYDQDGDGQDSAIETTDGTDCDDLDDTVYLDADEVPYDGIDQDCDGEDLTDVDGDGWDSEVVGGEDCNDEDPEIYPGQADPDANGVDENCDGVDGGDFDSDGFMSSEEPYNGPDCDDNDATIYPGATEIYYDGVDQNCDGWSDYDQDHDGYDSAEYSGTDCDDDSSSIYPGAREFNGDSVDSNCDGADESTEPAEAPSGCGCATGGTPLGSGLIWLLGLVGPLALRRRVSSRDTGAFR